MRGHRRRLKDYEIWEFTRPALDLTQPVLLLGNSGMGKTEYAKAHGKYPLVISRLDDLKKITDNTDLLIFDDMCFDDWEPEQVGSKRLAGRFEGGHLKNAKVRPFSAFQIWVTTYPPRTYRFLEG